MCFSASASFVAGTALSTIGVFTLKKVKHRTELPFALIPLLFGVQQITEGLVWLSFRFDISSLNAAAAYLYSLFAFVWWPIFVPFAVLSLETALWRKRVLYVLQFIGILVGSYLIYFHTLSPVISQVVNKSIVYSNSHFYTFLVLSLYFTATIGSCIFSSIKIIKIIGALIFLSAVTAYWFYSVSFVSVWCFFAAVLSSIIYLYFYFKYKNFKVKP